jgi:hypothetical protein|tara:strand:- start:266 stop:523 length:258 start_codon:yes stop_codon:yes gene_type:complete
MKNNQERIIASFVIAVGFWLMNISHTANNMLWGQITYVVSGLGFLGLLIFTVRTLIKGKQSEKILAWTCLIFALASAFSYLQMFF